MTEHSNYFKRVCLGGVFLATLACSSDPHLHTTSLYAPAGRGRDGCAEEGREDRVDQRWRVPRRHRVQQTIGEDHLSVQGQGP